MKNQKGETKISISLIKSALQKAVRRNEIEKAVIYSKYLIEQDEHQFLRRFPIVILEDALLHPKFVEVVEMLKKVGKKISLTNNDKDELIQITAQIAGIRVRDDWVDMTEGVFQNQEEIDAKDFTKLNFTEVVQLSKKEVDIIQAIKYRASIGGMKGDIVMLNNFVDLWAKRFVDKRWSFQNLEEYYEVNYPYTFESVKTLEKQDIMLEAVDFHCAPLLLILKKKIWLNNFVKQYYPNEEVEKVLKGVIWKQRSGINVKKEISSGKMKNWYGNRSSFVNNDEEKDKEMYQKLKRDIDGISEWFIKKQK